ncbi:type II secretion system F family protein [Haloarchaeobius amylolyticus]|uniref:type II secretion system F family protein n=1 Tax=Haloarchaeobius amylolyticus TaxID=1198296 RepID=UPI002271D1CE|nr:type II secretion system F family protein [Haloarchaeobius amylolyticus]
MSTREGSGIDTPLSEGQTPLPDYEVSQYFPRSRDMTPEERRELRDQYGVVRTYFKARPGKYRDVQRWLNQARIGTTYDIYLTHSAILAMVGGAVGAVTGVLLTFWLANMGILGGLTSPVSAPGGITSLVSSNRFLFAGGASALLLGGTVGGSIWAFRYYYPRNVVSNRERAINVVLPHAITYMYAMSYGGMNLVEVFRALADSRDTYGDVADEFDMIVRDMELFGNDLFTALRNARNLTPSDNLEQFLDDLVSVLDSGGDVTSFFEDQSGHYAETAKDEQEEFLETLSVLSEIFIVAFVAAPLFIIVTLMVISFLGGSTLTGMATLIYVGLPLGMVGFLLLIDVLSAPFVQSGGVTLAEKRTEPIDTDDVADDERFEAYRKEQRHERLVELARDPLAVVKATPYLSLVFTVPAALAFTAAVVVQEFATPSVAGFEAAPVVATTLLVVLPLLIVSVPLSFFHERKRRREKVLAERFPDTLNVLSSANYMGIPLIDALDMIARWSKGVLADELRLVRNDIHWNHDLTAALVGLGNRLKVPHLTRTIKLIAEGGKSSGDMSKILAIAAEDTRNRHRIDRARQRAMSSYIAIVVIGFLVYLMVIVLIDASYFGAIAQTTAQTENLAEAQAAGFASLSNVPLDTYRALFFHSVIIMAVGSGMLAGKLSDNDTLSGLKYSIGLTLVAVATFVLV